jgi:hypothetical protein
LRSWTKCPVREVTVCVVAGVRFDEPKSTKEKLATTRTPKILAIKACPDKAGQPGCGKVNAYVFGHAMIKDIYDNNNEQDAWDITEHKKPE